MNGLMAGMDEPIIERIGWALLHSLWQGGVAAVLYAGFQCLLRRRSAELRYWVGCALLLLTLAAPVFTACMVSPAIPTSAPRWLGRPDSVLTTGTHDLDPSPFSIAASGPAWIGQAGEMLQFSLPWLVCAWLVGVAVFSARWVQGSRWLRRVRSVTTEPLEPGWIRKLSELRWRMRVSRPVRLLQCTLIEVPMVVGWLRPVILLPASSITGLTPEQLEAILAHELAHVRRCDYLVNVIQNLAETLLFYHPAVWWISRGIRQEREHCCDDLVVRVCRDRLVYARALFRLEELRSVPSNFALAADGGSLLHRVRRLLLASAEPLPVGPKEFGGLALMALGCVLFLAGVTFMFGSPVYRSTSRVRMDSLAGSGREALSDLERLAPSPYLVQTEIEVIKSNPVLRQAADNLRLGEVFRARAHQILSEAAVLRSLQSKLRIKPVPHTALLEIQVADEDANESAAIANAVAAAYKEYRQQQRAQKLDSDLGVLKARLEQENARTRRAESNVEFLRVVLKVPDYFASGDAPTPTMTGDTLRKLEALRIEVKAELVGQETLLQKLKDLKESDLIQAIPSTGIPDTTLASYREQLNLAQQKQIGLVRDFGPNHTEVLKVNDQISDLRTKIRERAAGILLGLDAKAAALRQRLTDLENEVDKAMAVDFANAKESRPYWEAKRSLQESERFRQMLFMKIAAEETDQALSRSGVVEIVEQATPPRAVAPNRPRAGALMTSGLALAILGMVLVRRTTAPPQPA